MILRCIKRSIYEDLLEYIIKNGIRHEFDASIKLNISVDDDIFQLTLYPGISSKRRYLAVSQAVRTQKPKESSDYINIQLITDNKILENLVNLLVGKYLESQFKNAISMYSEKSSTI